MEAWTNFFIGELSAAAAFAGLLFVSVSVNLTRILEIGRLADRGLETLAILFLSVTVASLALLPMQPLRAFGGKTAIAALAVLVFIFALQRSYLAKADAAYRASAKRMAQLNAFAVSIFFLAGLALAASGDPAWLYLVPIAMLLTFLLAGASAWVLLVEINR